MIEATYCKFQGFYRRDVHIVKIDINIYTTRDDLRVKFYTEIIQGMAVRFVFPQ